MPTTPRRWFAFRLRTMLSVVVPLCAALLAAANYPREWIKARHEFLLAHRAAWVFVRGPRASQEVDPPWPLPLFGERGQVVVILLKDDGPEDHARARALFPEATITQRTQ